MNESERGYLRKRGFPQQALEEKPAWLTEERIKKLRVAIEKYPIVIIYGHNDSLKDAVVAFALGAIGTTCIYSPTDDGVTTGKIVYFSTFDRVVETKQSYTLRNRVRNLVASGSKVILGVTNLASLQSAHGDSFMKDNKNEIYTFDLPVERVLIPGEPL